MSHPSTHRVYLCHSAAENEPLRKWVDALAGFLLFAIGVAVGLGLSPTRTAEPPGSGQPASERRQDMARKEKPAAPSVADEEAAIIGVWVHSSWVRLIRFEKGEYGTSAYLLNEEGNDILDYSLEDRGRKRVLLEEWYETDGDHQNPLYEDQLRGDRLELKLLPDASPVYSEACELKVRSNPEGTWYRVRINKDARTGGGMEAFQSS